MKPISQIAYKDLEINFMETKDEVGYSFGFGGRNYGQKIKVDLPTTGPKRKLYIEAVACLFINAINSYENLKLNDTNNTVGTGVTSSESTGTYSRESK